MGVPSEFLLIDLQTIGENPNTWGDVANENYVLLERKLCDVTSIAVTGGTLNLTDSGPPIDQERVAVIEFTGVLASNQIVEFSGRQGFWLIRNSTTGAFTLTVRKVGQTGVQVSQSSDSIVFMDATDMRSFQPAADALVSVPVDGGTDVLTIAAENASVIEFTGTLASNQIVEFSGREGFWLLLNNTTGAFTLTVRKTGGTGFVIPTGAQVIGYMNPTDMQRLGVASTVGGNTFTGDNTFSKVLFSTPADTANTTFLAEYAGDDFGLTITKGTGTMADPEFRELRFDGDPANPTASIFFNKTADTLNFRSNAGNIWSSSSAGDISSTSWSKSGSTFAIFTTSSDQFRTISWNGTGHLTADNTNKFYNWHSLTDGALLYQGNCNNGDWAQFFGQAFKPGGGDWAAVSDERVKEDISDYGSGLSEVLKLRPVNYKYKTEALSKGDKIFVGLIAQEAMQAMPEMVMVKSGNMGDMHFDDLHQLDTTPLIFALVNAVKELKAEIDALKGV